MIGADTLASVPSTLGFGVRLVLPISEWEEMSTAVTGSGGVQRVGRRGRSGRRPGAEDTRLSAASKIRNRE